MHNGDGDDDDARGTREGMTKRVGWMSPGRAGRDGTSCWGQESWSHKNRNGREG
jgi:hypothetical protein